MHTDLGEKIMEQRLRALADEPAEPPYDWAEFERRRSGAVSARRGRNRLAAAASAVVAAALIAGFVIVRWSQQRTPPLAPADTARANTPDRTGSVMTAATADRLVQARTRRIEEWLAGLPHDPALVRVGTRAAVISLQDQIAALDDLVSTERVAGVRPGRLGALERQRARLVSSLAQLQYAEMLASATP